MKISELPINRNPESDRLFRCEPDVGDPVLIRVRLLEVPGQSTFVNQVSRDVLTVQLQSSVCRDETGDVDTDVDGAHLLLSPSRNSIHLDGVILKGIDLSALLEDMVLEEARRATAKAIARRLVFNKLAKLAV